MTATATTTAPSAAEDDDDDIESFARTLRASAGDCGDDMASPPSELEAALADVAAACEGGENAASVPGKPSRQEMSEAMRRLISGKSLLHWAIQVGQPVSVLAAAVSLGADVNQRDSVGNPALHLAVARNNSDDIKFLVGHGADIDAAADIRGMTALHWAVSRGFHQATRTLLSLGADPNKPDGLGASPFARALLAGVDDALVELFAVHASSVLNKLDSKGHTPIMIVIAEGNLRLLRLLIRLGADVNQCDKHSATPLHYAARRDNGGPFLVALLEAGAVASSRIRDEHGMTALEWADMKGTLTPELRQAFTEAASPNTSPVPS